MSPRRKRARLVRSSSSSSVEFTESQNRKRGSNRVAKHRITVLVKRSVGRPRKRSPSLKDESPPKLFAEEPFAIQLAPRESRSGRRVRRIQKALSSVVTTLFLDKKSNGSMSSLRASSEDAEYRPCFFASPRTTAVMTMSSIKHRRRGRPRKRLQIEAPHMTMSSPTSVRRLTVAADEPSSYRGRKRKAAMAFMKNGKEKFSGGANNMMELGDALSDVDCDVSFPEESLLCLGSDDEFEDERLLDERFLKKCGRRVMEVYAKVIKEYDERIRKEEAPNFAKIIEKLPLRRYHTYDDSTPTRLDIPPDDLSEFITHFKITDCRNMNAQRCGVRFLPALELRPRTAYWVHTECNIRADEEHRLSHIPFVSEDHDDKQFCAELRKLYDEGIHGADRGCDKYINDYVMFYMLEILKSEWEERLNSEKIMDHIFYAIFKLFPNKLSHRQLVTARGDLEERFAPGRTPSKSTQDLRASSDQNFHSVNVLCCERCCQYDCVLHAGPYDEDIKPFKRRQGERAPRGKPCSSHCHLIEVNGKNLVSYGLEENRSTRSRSSGSPMSPRSRSRPTNASDTGSLPSVPNGQVTNGKVAPFANPTLMNILVALLAGEQTSICLITAQMSMICQDIGVESRTCSEIYRLAAQLAEANPSLTPDQKKVSVKDKHRSFRSFTWADGKGQVENKERMVPCSHPGHCDGNRQCVCSSASGICSKFCGCPPDCRMRFPGCRCAPGNCRTKQCQCYFARWECDPDLCKSCKCDDLSMDGEKCRNVPLQRGHQKLLKVGISGIAGWGCFIQETADKGDLIAEYTGEVISKWESERRGLIYDKFCTSYIFGMNNDQFIDATRVGNLIRFANHSNISANCSSEIKIVNGEHRIGVYASRHILCGEELLFDYNYGQTWNKFVPIEKSIKAQANRSTPDSDSSRTAGSHNKPEKLRRSLLKKMVRGELKVTSEEIKKERSVDCSTASIKPPRHRGRPRIECH